PGHAGETRSRASRSLPPRRVGGSGWQEGSLGIFAIQIVIGALILCLSISVLHIHEVHYKRDVALVLVVVTSSGSVLIHSGRNPSLFWVSLSPTL
uniref:Si:dkey-81h8.1 n=1 Tax=Oryzias sinensis TaxID=183150 RepID=A0A8C7WLR1_9TELE